MSRPTDNAVFKFQKAYRFANQAGGFYQANTKSFSMEKGGSYLSAAVRELAEGLQHLSVGLRATYILLEEMKNSQGR